MPGGNELDPGLVCPPGAKPGVFQEDQMLCASSHPRLLGQVVNEPLLVVGAGPVLSHPLAHQV